MVVSYVIALVISLAIGIALYPALRDGLEIACMESATPCVSLVHHTPKIYLMMLLFMALFYSWIILRELGFEFGCGEKEDKIEYDKKEYNKKKLEKEYTPLLEKEKEYKGMRSKERDFIRSKYD